MAKLVDPWNHHDWSSKRYVSEWAEGQDERESDRKKVFSTIARILSNDPQAVLKILDLGAGYGALAGFLLNHFPNAKAVCQDGSAEMAKLGRKRMESLKERFQYVLCDFSKPGWSRTIQGPFDAAGSIRLDETGQASSDRRVVSLSSVRRKQNPGAAGHRILRAAKNSFPSGSRWTNYLIKSPGI